MKPQIIMRTMRTSADGHRAPLVQIYGERFPRCTRCGRRQPNPVTGEQPARTPWLADQRARRLARRTAP